VEVEGEVEGVNLSSDTTLSQFATCVNHFLQDFSKVVIDANLTNRATRMLGRDRYWELRTTSGRHTFGLYDQEITGRAGDLDAGTVVCRIPLIAAIYDSVVLREGRQGTIVDVLGLLKPGGKLDGRVIP
jgi:hypothetical protein